MGMTVGEKETCEHVIALVRNEISCQLDVSRAKHMKKSRPSLQTRLDIFLLERRKFIFTVRSPVKHVIDAHTRKRGL